MKKMKTRKDMYNPMFIEALFIIAKVWKQLKHPPTEDWIKRI